MLNFSEKSKDKLKNFLIFIGLFWAIFVSVFYVLNMRVDNFEVESSQEKLIQDLNKKDVDTVKFNASDVKVLDFSQWAKINNLTGENIESADPDKDGLSNYLEFVHLTNPNDADTDGDGYLDNQEIINGYDPDSKGDNRPVVEISISKIGVTAPMIWSKSEDDKATLKDLENGLSHYPKTASPGQIGNSIISGHSSNYIWAKGDYNYIFRDLNDLEIGDIIDVSSIQKNGRVILYKYKVNEKYVTTPNDERIFADSDSSELTLSTCWPLGTTFKRLIVKAELIK